MAKTGNEIITGIKRRITIPSSQPLFQDSDILAMVDDVIKSRLVPILVSMRQDYFVTYQRYPIVANQSEYAIPQRAVGRTLRDLKRVDSSNGKTDMTLVGIEDEHLSAATGTASQFYFKGDKIAVVPVPKSAGDYLEMWYEIMPSQITKTDAAATVTSISTNDVSVSSVPTAITTGSSIDFICGIAGHSLKGMSKTVSNISGNVITFTSGDVPTDLVAGDYIALAGKTPVMQLPDECWPYLETETSYRILQSISDYEGARFLKDDIKVELDNMKMLLEPRIQGEATKIIPRMGLARGSRSRWKWGFLR